MQEGYITFYGYKTWYKIVGNNKNNKKLPLICIHGGPGIPHDYLQSLEDLSNVGRQVIFYDQLGCGNSDRPTEIPWSINFFKDELNTILKQLKIKQYHIFGHSWGGMLALEHALDKPKGLQSLILGSTLTSISQWIFEAQRLKSLLPLSTQQIINKHEINKTTQTVEYMQAVQKYYNLYVCKLEPWPEQLIKALASNKINQNIYNKMWGPSEFTITGALKDWDISKRLIEINVPTLITSGYYDESTPSINKRIHDNIINSRWVLFKQSAHLPHVEETILYVKTLIKFLSRVELKIHLGAMWESLKGFCQSAPIHRLR